MSQVRARKSWIPGAMQALASLQTARGYRRGCCRQDRGECRQQSEREGAVAAVQQVQYLFSDGAGFCTEGIVRWERCVSFGEVGVGVITLKRVKDITVLVQGIAGVMMLVNTHL